MQANPPMTGDDLRQQLRLRSRRLTALLNTAPEQRVRRSALRDTLLLDAWQRAQPLSDHPLTARRQLTEALLDAWLAGRDAARTAAESDPFAMAHLRRISRLQALDSALDPTRRLLAWDTVLTAAELRPSAVAGARLEGALRHAQAARADRRGLQEAVAEAAQGDPGHGDPGPWLRRQGIRDAQGLVARVWDLLEESLFLILPTNARAAAVKQAVANLRSWDARLAEMHARLAARPRQADVAQDVIVRFLEPRTVAAYAGLPPTDLVRVALAAGRNLHVTTLTGPQTITASSGQADGDPLDRLADKAPSPEDIVDVRGRWQRLFKAIETGLNDGKLTPQGVVFLWLAPALGAGEAWRISGGPLERIGSANYHQKKGLALLATLAGAGSAERPPNPGRANARTRGLVALLAMRAADPYIERLAELPADLRTTLPPPDDVELVRLMALLNLGGDGERGGALVARCLKIQRYGAKRAAAALASLAAIDALPVRSDQAVDHRAVAFVLTSMVLGRPSEAARCLDDSANLDAARAEHPPATLPAKGSLADCVQAWVAAGATTSDRHEVIDQLQTIGWPVPPPADPLKRRPVEREAQLRLHLRGVAAPR